MLHTTLMLGRFACVVFSFFLFYIAFFLYEDEEKNIKNRLDLLWTRVDDLAKTKSSRSVAFFQIVSERFSRTFNFFLLKHRHFLQFAIMANLVWAAVSLNAYAHSQTDDSSLFLWSTWIIAAGLIAIGAGCSSSAIIRAVAVTTGYSPLVLIVIGIMFYMLFLGSMKDAVDTAKFMTVVFAVLCLLIEGLLMFCRYSGWALKIAASTGSVWRLFSPLAIVFALALAGYLLLNWLSDAPSWAIIPGLSMALLLLAAAPAAAGLTIFALIMLVHRQAWPTIARLIYAINRNDLIANKKLMLGFAGASLAFGFGLPDALKQVYKLIGAA